MPESANTELCGSYLFSFVRHGLPVTQSGLSSLHSHQRSVLAPVSSHPCQHLLLSLFLQPLRSVVCAKTEGLEGLGVVKLQFSNSS